MSKKGKKKGKTNVSLKVSNDTWQDQMEDEDYSRYDDDFMYLCLFSFSPLSSSSDGSRYEETRCPSRRTRAVRFVVTTCISLLSILSVQCCGKESG